MLKNLLTNARAVILFVFVLMIPLTVGLNRVNAEEALYDPDHPNGKTINQSQDTKEDIIPQATGDIVFSFPQPGGLSRGMTYDGQYLWIVSDSDNLIYQVDPANGAVVRSIPLLTGNIPQGMAWDGQYLWLAVWQDSNLYQIDPATGAAIKTIPSPTGNPYGLTWDGNYLWLQCPYCSNSGYAQIDPNSGSVLRYLPYVYAWGLTFDGQYLWADTRDPYNVSQVDINTGAIVQVINPSTTFVSTFGMAWDGQYLWVNDLGTGMIHQMDVGVLIAAAVCDIQMSQASYTSGDTVTADVFRIANPDVNPICLEWKVWLGIPSNPPISIINMGANGIFCLTAGFDQDFGPINLFPAAGMPTGSYEFSCRMLDPVTGELLSEDLNPFTIQ